MIGGQSDVKKQVKQSRNKKCGEIKMPTKFPITDNYRMVKIEFKPIVREDLEGYPQMFTDEAGNVMDVANAADVASYFGAQFKSQKVERLEEYQASIQSTFFVATIWVICNFSNQIQRAKKQDVGPIKILLLGGLFLLLIFNAPYKLVGWINLFHSKLFIALDTLNTSVTMAMVMFINLVVSHGLSASSEMTPAAFYGPKLVVCTLVFFSIWIWQYADKLNYLAYFQNEFEEDQEAS